MTPAPIESLMTDERTLREKAADTLRQTAHLSHEARLFKTLVADAIEDARHAAQRTIRLGRQTALDARDEMTYRIKREPVKVVALVFGAGAVLGVILGLACARPNAAKRPMAYGGEP